MKTAAKVLVFLSVLLIGILTGCRNKEGEEGSARVAKGKESPALAALVESREAPPLEERLPANPLVEKVVGEIGTYGGIMRKVWRGAGKDKWGVTKMMEEYLLRYEEGKIVPNVAESYEIQDDSKRFVFHLREGMKWSDGVPFTADDVLFYWQEILQKDAYGKGIPRSLLDATVTKIDQYTFQISFPTSRYLFPIEFMSSREFFAPAHYLKTILPKFIGSEKAKEMALTEGFSDAQAMVRQKGYYFWLYEEVPKLTAWVAANDLNENIYVLERNPYYWKVDAQGNQLPYIDRIEYTRVEDNSANTLKAIAGELDFQYRGMSTNDFTILKENEERGGYKVVLWKGTTNENVAFNPTTEDPFLRELFRDRRFRQAVSLAIDREEINEIAYDGLSVPRQASLIPGVPSYSAAWEKAYAALNVGKANKLLDELGLAWDKNKEYRLRPEGKVLEILFTHRHTNLSELAAYELVASHLKEIGLKIVVKQLDRTYYEDLRDTNKLEMSHVGIQGLGIRIDHKGYVPTRREEVHWGMYGHYVKTEGAEGEKPEGDMARLIEYWDALNNTPFGPAQEEWLQKIIDLHKENVWMTGLRGLEPKVVIVNGKMRNVPDSIYDADILRTPGNAKPWQFFYGSD